MLVQLGARRAMTMCLLSVAVAAAEFAVETASSDLLPEDMLWIDAAVADASAGVASGRLSAIH